MHKIYQNNQIGKSLKVRCLEEDLSKTLSILMVLIFLGTKFCEFYEYQVDRKIWYLRRYTFMAVHENEYTVIFCQKSKAQFEYMQRMDFFIIVHIQAAFRYILLLNIALIQATATYLNKSCINSILTKHSVWVCEPRNIILTKVSTRNTQLLGE